MPDTALKNINAALHEVHAGLRRLWENKSVNCEKCTAEKPSAGKLLKVCIWGD